MDALTPIALIAFVAQFLMWLGLPERTSSEVSMLKVETEAMAA